MSKARALAEETHAIYTQIEGEPTPSEDLLFVIAKTLTALLGEAEEQNKRLRQIASNTD